MAEGFSRAGRHFDADVPLIRLYWLAHDTPRHFKYEQLILHYGR